MTGLCPVVVSVNPMGFFDKFKLLNKSKIGMIVYP